MSDKRLNALIDLMLAGNFVVWFCAEREVVQRCCQRCAGMLRSHGYCYSSIQCHATYFFPQSQYTSNIRKAYADQLRGLPGATRLPDCSDDPPLRSSRYDRFCHALV